MQTQRDHSLYCVHQGMQPVDSTCNQDRLQWDRTDQHLSSRTLQAAQNLQAYLAELKPNQLTELQVQRGKAA